MRFRIKVNHMLFIMIFSAFLAAYLIPSERMNIGGDKQLIQNSITVIGVLFGIIVGFFIADLYTRFQKIRECAAVDSSSLSTFYFLASVIGENKKNRKWLNKVEERINNYIHKFMPIPWERYSETEEEFNELGKSLKEIKYSNEKENMTYLSMLSVYAGHSTAREGLVMYGKDKLTLGEWLVISFLGILLILSLFYIKDGTMVSVVFTGLLTSAVLLLFVILRDLDDLNFGENEISVEPYERVLDAIGRPRYYGIKDKDRPHKGILS